LTQTIKAGVDPAIGGTMLNRRALLAGASAALLPASAFAQSTWPDGKVIKGIVPFAAGSATDTIARVYADQMSKTLGTSIIIENRAGANGMIGADAAAKSAPDGLTILFGTNSTNAAAPALFKSVPFDHEKDFAPIAYMGSVPLLVCVANKVEAKTLKELIALAKASPGKLNFGSASSSQRVSTEMMMSMAGIKMNLVTYRASPQAVTDLISGQIDVFVADLAVMLPQVQAGTIRALAATSADSGRSWGSCRVRVDRMVWRFRTHWYAARRDCPAARRHRQGLRQSRGAGQARQGPWHCSFVLDAS
jgi:tripartite-type tricarboxylate transporter receptor subunit TctC